MTKTETFFERFSDLFQTYFEQLKASTLVHGDQDWNFFLLFNPLLVVAVWKETKKENLIFFQKGITHLIRNHFVKNHKDDQKLSGWSLRQKYLLCYGSKHGVTYELQGSVKRWRVVTLG